MTCENCFYFNTCYKCHTINRFGDPYIHVYWNQDAEKFCGDFLSKDCVKILPCPIGTTIWGIKFDWGCDCYRCPLELGRCYENCSDCSEAKNCSEIFQCKYEHWMRLGDKYFLTKEEAEQKLASMVDEEVKTMWEYGE